MPPIDIIGAFFCLLLFSNYISNIGNTFITHIFGKHTILMKHFKWKDDP